MKPTIVAGACAFLGGALAAVLWLPRGSPAVDASGEPPAAGATGIGAAAPRSGTAGSGAGRDTDPPAGQPSPVSRTSREVASGAAAAGVSPAPVKHAFFARVRPASSGTPSVSRDLAFKALLYVGVDPEAEKTWMRAINDPRLPPGVRSDLIEDLNDEGYSDPGGNNLTKEDLPLILARLEIIERLAPYAMDKVNADAFEEAYKDLLEMYVRLGGPPRKRK